MGSEGQVCHRCPDGMFMHRSFWTYTYNEHDQLVDVQPQERSTEEFMIEYRRLADRDIRHNGVISPRVAARLLRYPSQGE